MGQDAFAEQSSEHDGARLVVQTFQTFGFDRAFGVEQPGQEVVRFGGHVEEPIADPEHGSVADRREPDQGTRRE